MEIIKAGIKNITSSTFSYEINISSYVILFNFLSQSTYNFLSSIN